MPGVAAAQFTTFIPPVNTTADSVKAAVVAAQQVQKDSVVAAQVTNMKTWVDSAAGLAQTSATTADSLSIAPTPPTTAAVDSATFANGARAPATASALPLLMLLGIALVCAGVIVGRGVPRMRPVRVRARRNGA
jgi:hypothetical protein